MAKGPPSVTGKSKGHETEVPYWYISNLTCKMCFCSAAVRNGIGCHELPPKIWLAGACSACNPLPHPSGHEHCSLILRGICQQVF